MMSNLRESTVVNILGKEYRIACASEEEPALFNAARLVDERMQDIRKNGKVIGTDRIAVMAALNLAHDLLARPVGDLADAGDAQRRLHHLRERVESALDESAPAAVK